MWEHKSQISSYSREEAADLLHHPATTFKLTSHRLSFLSSRPVPLYSRKSDPAWTNQRHTYKVCQKLGHLDWWPTKLLRSMWPQFARSCCFQLYNNRRIRLYLSEHAEQLLVQALVLSHINYCHSLLAGLPEHGGTSGFQPAKNSTSPHCSDHSTGFQLPLTSNSKPKPFKTTCPQNSNQNCLLLPELTHLGLLSLPPTTLRQGKMTTTTGPSINI